MLRVGERQLRAEPWLGCAPGLEHGAGLGQGQVWGRDRSGAGGCRTWSKVGWGAHVPLIHSF